MRGHCSARGRNEEGAACRERIDGEWLHADQPCARRCALVSGNSRWRCRRLPPCIVNQPCHWINSAPRQAASGCRQQVRRRPHLHRWGRRLYVASARSSGEHGGANRLGVEGETVAEEVLEGLPSAALHVVSDSATDPSTYGRPPGWSKRSDAAAQGAKQIQTGRVRLMHVLEQQDEWPCADGGRDAVMNHHEE